MHNSAFASTAGDAARAAAIGDVGREALREAAPQTLGHAIHI